MGSFVSKHAQWDRDNHVKSFRTEKTAKKYMAETAEQNWQKVDVTTLPKQALKVFDAEDFEEIEEFNTFYENDLGQFLEISSDYGNLYNVSLLEYIDKDNVVDTDDTPILIDLFKPYVDNSEGISKLFEVACAEFGFDNLTTKADVKLVNKWIIQQMETHLRPVYFYEKQLAYLMVIIGELILRNKLADYHWQVEKTRLAPRHDKVETKHIYVPYLCNSSGSKLDIHQAFREYLFYEASNIRNVFTNVYNNIEKYEFTKRRGQTLPYLFF